MESLESLADFLTRPVGGWRGLMTVLGVGVIGNLVANIIAVWTGNSVWQLGLSIALLLVFLAGVWAIRRSQDLVLVPENQRPDRKPGLIVLVGTGRPGEDPMEQSAGIAIAYHRPVLKTCWLIASSGEKGSLPVAQTLEKQCRAEGIEVHIHALADPFSVQESYDLVEHIYAEEVPAAGLAENQVIADFTGGIKPMSAGMILACQGTRLMQYMYGRKERIASIPRSVKFQPRGGRA
jgi:hypothetical protein